MADAHQAHQLICWPRVSRSVPFPLLPSPPRRWKLFHRVVKHSKLVFFCSLASIKKNGLLMFKVTVVHHLFSSQLVHFFYISSLKKFKTTRWTLASQPADLSVWKRPCCSFAALLFCSVSVSVSVLREKLYRWCACDHFLYVFFTHFGWLDDDRSTPTGLTTTWRKSNQNDVSTIYRTMSLTESSWLTWSKLSVSSLSNFIEIFNESIVFNFGWFLTRCHLTDLLVESLEKCPWMNGWKDQWMKRSMEEC